MLSVRRVGDLAARFPAKIRGRRDGAADVWIAFWPCRRRRRPPQSFPRRNCPSAQH